MTTNDSAAAAARERLLGKISRALRALRYIFDVDAAQLGCLREIRSAVDELEQVLGARAPVSFAPRPAWPAAERFPPRAVDEAIRAARAALFAAGPLKMVPVAGGKGSAAPVAGCFARRHARQMADAYNDLAAVHSFCVRLAIDAAAPPPAPSRD